MYQESYVFHSDTRVESHNCPFFLLLWTSFLYKYHVRAFCRRASAALYCSTASTAQHSTAQPNTAQHSAAQHSTAQHSTAQYSTAQRNQPAQSREASTCRSECDDAGKQTESIYLLYYSTAKQVAGTHSLHKKCGL